MATINLPKLISDNGTFVTYEDGSTVNKQEAAYLRQLFYFGDPAKEELWLALPLSWSARCVSAKWSHQQIADYLDAILNGSQSLDPYVHS